MKVLNSQDLKDLVDGASIFSAGGGGDSEAGHRIVEGLVSQGYKVKLLSPIEVPQDRTVTNFACVGATTAIDYDSDAAMKTLKTLEEYLGVSTFATIPVELGGFNTLTAVDVAARCGIPVVDADGAGRSVPEVHLKVYTIDNIPLTPMVVSDAHAKNTIVVKETKDSRAGERIARILAAEWNHSAYTARRILTGNQVKTSPIPFTLSKSMKIGRLLRKDTDPIRAILDETDGSELFQGTVVEAVQKTEGGFTSVNIKLQGNREYARSSLELKAKNEVLAAYRDEELVALAPDIITPVHFKTGKCITAEKTKAGDSLSVLVLPAAQKWKTPRGLELWRDVLRRSGITETYETITRLTKD